MGLYKSETVKMQFNGYNFKAEWTIPNFIAFTGNEYNSPLFTSDNFQVQLSLKNSLSKDSDGLEINFSFVSIPASGLSLNYNLSIENTDKNKSEKISGDEVLNNSKTEFKIFTKTQSSQITSENGYLLDGALTIICFFRANSSFDAYSSSSLEKVTREVVAETDWTIKESINEFHSTEEPLQVSIDDKVLSFAFTFEKTESDNYSLTLILVEPEFSFKGEFEVALVNQKDDNKSIKKTQKLRFDRIQYETDPIVFDEISQETLMNPENGWIALNKDTSEIESGVHFIIKFINLKKEEESKESVFSRLSQMIVHNEKELRENIPITIEPIRNNKFDFNVKFPNILSNNLEEPISSPEFHTGGICEKYIIDFPSKSFFFDITEFPQNGSFMKAKITFLNQDPSRQKSITFSFLYCPSKKSDTKELPISIQEISNPEKGWLFDGALKINAEFEAKSYTKSYLYPVQTNASTNDLYGFRFLIPMSLFNPDSESKIIDFPCVIAKKINITPFINYSYDENDGNKLRIQTNFDVSLTKEESVTDFIFDYANKNPDKNFVATFADVDRDHIQMPLFIPEKSFEEDGFVFVSESSKKVLHLYLRIHFKEKNAYTSDYTVGTYQSISYEQRKTQDESKEPAMLPDRSLSAEQQAKARSQHADSFEQFYGDFGKTDEIDYGPHDFASKKDTGYVGLKNQGATCYMNSLLQSLYHLPAFRRLVYDLPTTGSEDPNTNIPLNLQRLFSQMQFSDKSCSTVNLTKSFGWGSAETFQQHDIEEFLRVLIDNLENKMKGTNLQDSIPHLFRGEYRNYIKCKKVDYQSSHEESFYDLSMDVKGIPNLYESFKSYVKQEELTGDNQYTAEGFGKQDAIMGREFIEFPPVLHLQLKRFMFDYTRQNGMYKINDQFEFPESIDLTEFLAKDSPSREKSNIYDLYGVLVHQGGVFGGHYYAFLRTSTSPQWYKFNDSSVSKDTAEHAITDNFGYSPNNPFLTKNEKLNGQQDFDIADEENEENEIELDEIINDNERRFTENRSAEMGIDICGGGKEEDDISIHGRDETYPDFERRHGNEVYDQAYYDMIKREMKMKNKNNKHKNKHSNHDYPRSEKSYSGYMLVYIRRDEAESIFEPISDESVPNHLKSYINNITREEKSSAKDKTTIIVHCSHESVLRKNTANNVFGFFPPETENIEIKPEKKEPEEPEKKETQQITEPSKTTEKVTKIDLSINSFDQTFDKSISTAELYTLIGSRIGLDPSRIRLWRCGYENLPTKIIPNSEKSNIAFVSDNKNGMTVFIQSMKEENEKLDIGNNYMIYVKFFFSEELLKKQNDEIIKSSKLLKKQLKNPLQYLFSTTVSHDSKIESLYPLINEKLGFPKETKLQAYQETLNKSVTKLTSNEVFRKSSIGNGSTLIFEMSQESIEKVDSIKINFEFEYQKSEFDDENEEQNESNEQQHHHLRLYKQNELDNEKNPMKSIQNYFQGENNITLEIYDYKNPKKPLCLIQFSREIKISDAKKFILRAARSETKNEELNENEVDLSSILLFRMKNDEIVKIEIDQLYANQILRFHFNDEPPKGKKHHQLYFYISPFKGVKSSEFIKYITKFSVDAKTIDAEESVYLPKNSKCCDIFNVFKSFFIEEKESNSLINQMFVVNDNKFRFLLIEDQVIERVFTNESTIVPYDVKMTFRIEVVPKNQINVDSEKLLRCYYSLDLSKNKNSTFNQPFLMDIIKDELFNQTKKRLKLDFMDLPESDNLDTYKFYLMIGSGNNSLKGANVKRMERKKSLENNNKDDDDDEVSGSYEVLASINSKFVELDDFAMLSEFAEDNTYELQLVIVLSSRNEKYTNYVKSDNHNKKESNGDEESRKDDKDKIDLRRSDIKHHRAPAKSHPSHNDVRIYN